MQRWYKSLILMLIFSSALFAQNRKITGTVTSTASGEKLIGANVILKGTTLGAASDENGKFMITAPEGNYTIAASYVGYETVQYDIELNNNMNVDFSLDEKQFSLSVTVLAERAKERETPVAFTNIDKKEMEKQLGSRDIPMILNTTPSVYATAQGGGAGDARINIRGFDQRNVAIMINGVPVNDMENGWVYWSNWDGLGDATSSIQVQRGLSAVNLATPSIGGTMNIVSDPTASKYGIKLKQEFGNDAFLKTTVSLSTGKVGKFALNANFVKKSGDGLIDKTWTDAWSYYLGMSYDINNDNRVELYALGAPQRHGQNLYKQNAATYDAEFAKSELGYSDADVSKFVEKGRLYNQNWAPVDPIYRAKQWDGNKAIYRYGSDFINTRENFYHKPIVNLNWYSKLSKSMNLYSTLYYSGGEGGGTGTYGSIYRRDGNGKLGDANYKFYYGPGPWVWDLNQQINVNRAGAGTYYIDKKGHTKADGESIGILRNSRNNQWTVGLISKLNWKLNKNWTTSFGVDWRTAGIDHFREVRDLLGGKYYIYKGNDFDSPSKQKKVIGDKIAYNNSNTVDWFGAYGQAEYSKDKLTAYGTAGWSMIKYSYINHFKMDAQGKELETKGDWINGYQFKGGASFRMTTNWSLYANLGYVQKVPIFDQVINDFDGTMNSDPKNEKFTSFELGTNWLGFNGKLRTNLNLYYTTWLDRSNNVQIQNVDGTTDIVSLTGIDANHMGVEAEISYKPIQLFQLDAIVSVGDWKYLDDATGVYKDYSSGTGVQKEFNYYIKDLKTGDQPQTSIVFGATVNPVKNMSLQVLYSYYTNHYANWDPTSRTDKTDRGQSWQAPAYGKLDVNFFYGLPRFFDNVDFTLFANVFNATDALFIQDATDNSPYNGISGAESHSAQRAEVYLGLPRTFNLGLSVAFK